MGLGSAIKSINVPSGFGKFRLKVEKTAPTLMMIGGISLVIGGTVLACKQTLKASKIIDECNAKLNDILETAENSDPEEYSEQDARKDRMVVYRDLGWSMVKTYGPAALAIGAGLGLIIGSHKILSGRNAALTAGYSALLANYQQYRQRVRDEFGEDEEVRIFSGAKKGDGVVYDEDGEVIETVSDGVIFDDGSGHSPYARLFSLENLEPAAQGNWTKSPAQNLKFLRSAQCWANDTLRTRGYLFLNEVYRYLGFPDSSDGCIVGWLWDPKRDKIINPDVGTAIVDGVDSQGLRGDNVVDFGIYTGWKNNKGTQDFLNGLTPCVWLDFNVDGVIYDKI